MALRASWRALRATVILARFPRSATADSEKVPPRPTKLRSALRAAIWEGEHVVKLPDKSHRVCDSSGLHTTRTEKKRRQRTLRDGSQGQQEGAAGRRLLSDLSDTVRRDANGAEGPTPLDARTRKALRAGGARPRPLGPQRGNLPALAGRQHIRGPIFARAASMCARL
jgi:hypothetical protein